MSCSRSETVKDKDAENLLNGQALSSASEIDSEMNKYMDIYKKFIGQYQNMMKENPMKTNIMVSIKFRQITVFRP